MAEVPMKRWFRLTSRVLVKRVETAFSSENCHVKWNGTRDTCDIIRHKSTLPGYTCWPCAPICRSATSLWRNISFHRTMHLIIAPEFQPNVWMNTPQTWTCFPGPRGHLTSIPSSTYGILSKDIFEPLTLYLPIKSSWTVGDCSMVMDRYAFPVFPLSCRVHAATNWAAWYQTSITNSTVLQCKFHLFHCRYFQCKSNTMRMLVFHWNKFRWMLYWHFNYWSQILPIYLTLFCFQK